MLLLAQVAQPEPAAAGPAVAPAGRATSSPAGAKAAATWPCPTCGEDNPIELDTCAVCGTSFAQLLRQEEAPGRRATRRVPVVAHVPGVGHAKVGRAPDGIARDAVRPHVRLALVIVVSGVRTGPVFAVVLLLLVAALTLYLGSAAEAYRIADGGEPFLSARALLWATVALIMIAVSLLAMSAITVNQS